MGCCRILRWGIVYVSLLFAILRMGFLSWIDVVFVLVVALLFGWVVKKTGSLPKVTLFRCLYSSLYLSCSAPEYQPDNHAYYSDYNYSHNQPDPPGYR